MLSLFIAFASTPRSAFFFGAAAAAHASMGSGSIVAQSSTKGPDGVTKSRFELVFRWPSELRLKRFDKTGLLVRDLTVEPVRSIDFDPRLGQYAVSAHDPGELAGGVLSKMDTSLDDLILGLTDPEAMKAWIDPLQALSGWIVTNAQKTIDANFHADGRTILVSLDKATTKLASVRMTDATTDINWKLTYRQGLAGMAFVPPVDATRVPYFDKDMLPPKYADGAARELAQRVYGAYDGLQSLGYTVKRSGGETRVVMAGKFARQTDARADWTYDGNSLVLLDKSRGKWHRGDMSFPDVIDTVAEFGTRVDPTLKLLMAGFNPYRKRFGDGATLRATGTMRVRGVDASLLTSVSENVTISLVVRESDGLVINSTARATDANEGGEGSVELSYEYFNVPSDAQARYALKIPRGTKALSFSKRKKG